MELELQGVANILRLAGASQSEMTQIVDTYISQIIAPQRLNDKKFTLRTLARGGGSAVVSGCGTRPSPGR